MRNERYDVRISNATMTFDFISEGPRGLIKKRVQYRLVHNENIYNLVLGDVDPETDTFDDKVISDNNDSKKVLSTVAATAYTFTEKYPNPIVYAQGSNAARTRLYRIGISNNLEELTKDFNVFGFFEDIGWVEYRKNEDYSAFYIIRK